MPDQSPLAWTCINLFCLVWSLILVFDIFLVEEDLEDRPGAAAMYLVWNFGTTAVWCVEVGLQQVGYHASCHDDKNHGTFFINNHGDDGGGTQRTRFKLLLDRWVRWIELGLAVFFLVDSMMLLYKWRLAHNHLEEELGEVLINVFAYLFISRVLVSLPTTARLCGSGSWNYYWL